MNIIVVIIADIPAKGAETYQQEAETYRRRPRHTRKCPEQREADIPAETETYQQRSETHQPES